MGMINIVLTLVLESWYLIWFLIYLCIGKKYNKIFDGKNMKNQVRNKPGAKSRAGSHSSRNQVQAHGQPSQEYSTVQIV